MSDSKLYASIPTSIGTWLFSATSGDDGWLEDQFDSFLCTLQTLEKLRGPAQVVFASPRQPAEPPPVPEGCDEQKSRESEVEQLQAELAESQRLAAGLAERVHAQSELLAKRAERAATNLDTRPPV